MFWTPDYETRADAELSGFHQSISPLSEGNLVDLVLGVLLWFSFLFFLSNPSLALVALVGFGSEGLDHLVWSCLFALVALGCALHEDSWD